MPTLISREVEFDAGHRVPNHSSKCRNPHGHRYRVVATVTGQLVDRSGASDEGMVVDFGVLSELLKTHVHDVYDHGFIVYEGDEIMQMALMCDDTWKVIKVGWIPTAENMAHSIFEDLYPRVAEMGSIGSDKPRVTLASVEVHETPKSEAVYWGGI
jgi:6-pyruvoyltetrahydropterin/6-carboxytetrahydropterin synthase